MQRHKKTEKKKPAQERPSEEFLRQMTWEEKAKLNPMWVVRTTEEFLSGDLTSEQVAKFFAIGEAKVAALIAPWLRAFPEPEKVAVLEFGCGVGRMLKAVCKITPHCCGVDISPTMISHARKNLPDNVELRVLGPNGDLPVEDQSFDGIFSHQVFQHISKRSVLVKALSEFGRALKPGGKVKFNIDFPYPFFRRRFRPEGWTYGLENYTISFGRMKRLRLWRPYVRKHDHWSGIRLSYSQLYRYCMDCGIHIDGLQLTPSTEPDERLGSRSNWWPKMSWLLGTKIA